MILFRMYAIFFALSLFHFGNAYADLPEKNEGLIGEIRLSLLTETQFQGLYGKEWVLMDGHSIEGKELAKYFGVTNTLPDARGHFLRMHNNGKTPTEGNPDDTPLGGIQKDQNQKHDHTIKRSYGDANAACSRIVTVGRSSPGGHTECASDVLKIEPSGGNEARPRSVTVNFFVKVNNTPADKVTTAMDTKINETKQTIIGVIQELPEHLIKNRAFLVILDNYIKLAVDQRLAERK